MKMKSILLSLLAVVALASCQKEDLDTTPDSGLSVDEALLSLTVELPTTNGTRANGEGGEATEGESTITELFLLTYDVSGNKLDKVTYITLSDGAQDPVKVSDQTTHVFVIANPPTELKLRINTATTFDQLAKVLATTATDTATDTDFASAHSFTMVNAATNEDVISNGLVPVISTEKDEVTSLTVAVAIERLVAKIGVQETLIGAELPSGCAKFTVQGYLLTTTNKTTFPYSKVVKYGIATKYPYRIDPNYTEVSKDDFNWLYGYKTNSYTDWNAVADSDFPDQIIYTYCLENTNDATADNNVTTAVTKVIVKAEYLMTNVAAGNSWFVVDGVQMSIDNLKSEYTKISTENLKAVIDLFMTECCTDGTNIENLIESRLNGEAAFEVLQLTGNDKGKMLKLYQKSMCYYEIPIHHDSRVATDATNKLGRWGVIRNNWYTINLDEITGIGTPIIPEEEEGELDPGKVNLIATITVNPWATWDQNSGLDPK